MNITPQPGSRRKRKSGSSEMFSWPNLMAQAIANLDIFYFPDPDKVKMAKDVKRKDNTRPVSSPQDR